MSPNSATYDGNGNVIAYADIGTGAKSATYEYGAFGETIVADRPMREAFPFRFSTKFTDNETGLLYYGLRYYSPSAGRWVNRDPSAEQGGSNLYSFCSNSSINGIDLLGLVFTGATTRTPVVGPVTNGNHAGETSFEFIGYRNELKRGRTPRDCHELVLEGHIENIIVFRSVADQNDTAPDGTGKTTSQHEAHHANINSREWEHFIREANPYEKKYCTLNCGDASRSVVRALRDLFLARRALANAEFDWEAYAGNPKYGLHDISEQELAAYRKGLHVAEEKLDQKKSEMEEACR